MGRAQRFGDHTIIGRAIADKTIQVRDPQLLKLPIPLPSVPVLTPLLSPLVGGNEDTTTTTSAAAAATSAAASAPASSSSSSGGSSGSSNTGTGNSGSSSSGGDSGSSSSGTGSTSSSTGDTSSSGDTSAGASGDTTSAGTSGDTTTTSTGDTTSTSTGDTTTTPGGTSEGSTGGTTSSGLSTSDAGTSVNDDATDSGGSVIPGSSTGTSGTSSSSSEGTPSGGLANAGSVPGAPSSGASGISGTSLTGTHSIGGAGYPSSTDGAAGGGTDSGNTGASQQGTSHGLSGTTIAAIVVVLVVILLAGFIVLVRRRSRARRDERANRWWFAKYRTSQTYGDQESEEIWAGRRSVRSSFATTVDHSSLPRTSDLGVIPPLPPMAEVGRANGSAPMLILDTSQFSSNNGQIENRFSIGSGHSGQSENGQYLVIHHRDSVEPELGTPMSVRPFSPSESFAFPKPPDPAGDRTSAYSKSASLPASSRPSSTATFAMMKTPTSGSFRASRIAPPTPALPTLTISPVNYVVDPFLDNNPFDDPAIAPNASSGEFAETEFVRRPFHPTLPDELAVRPDDHVHVLQAFDDGWALVSKVHPDDANGKGNGENAAVENGLIPIDCLREPGQDLTTFIAAKRVSSYAESVEQGSYNAI